MTKPRDQTLNLPLAAAELIPHRPPMLLVERLIERQGDRARASASVPKGGAWCEDGTVSPEYFVEIVAQAAALATGFDSRCDGGTIADGMLAGIDSFELRGTAEPGMELEVRVEKTFGFGPVSIIHGEVYHGSELLACGEIKVWENPDQESSPP